MEKIILFILENNFILLAIGVLLIINYRYWWRKTRLKYDGEDHLFLRFNRTHIFYWFSILGAFIKILLNIFLSPTGA